MTNLLTILSAFSGRSMADHGGATSPERGYGDLKKERRRRGARLRRAVPGPARRNCSTIRPSSTPLLARGAGEGP